VQLVELLYLKPANTSMMQAVAVLMAALATAHRYVTVFASRLASRTNDLV
jgi:hypothetical protein